MKKTHATVLTALMLLTATTACRGPVPCPDCEENADEDEGEDEQEEGQDLPDLPCGGADLMTDNHNCGSCGHECPLWYEGTEWEAGACEGGECGPTWSPTCATQFGGASCEEICDGFGRTCVANGCAGLTALLIRVGFDGNCDISHLHDTMAGSCDEPIPWESTVEWNIHADCCCK